MTEFIDRILASIKEAPILAPILILGAIVGAFIYALLIKLTPIQPYVEGFKTEGFWLFVFSGLFMALGLANIYSVNSVNRRFKRRLLRILNKLHDAYNRTYSPKAEPAVYLQDLEEAIANLVVQFQELKAQLRRNNKDTRELLESESNHHKYILDMLLFHEESLVRDQKIKRLQAEEIYLIQSLENLQNENIMLLEKEVTMRERLTQLRRELELVHSQRLTAKFNPVDSTSSETGKGFVQAKKETI